MKTNILLISILAFSFLLSSCQKNLTSYDDRGIMGKTEPIEMVQSEFEFTKEGGYALLKSKNNDKYSIEFIEDRVSHDLFGVEADSHIIKGNGITISTLDSYSALIYVEPSIESNCWHLHVSNFDRGAIIKISQK